MLYTGIINLSIEGYLIGINDFAILYVVLSEVENQDLLRKNYHVLVATPKTVRIKDNVFTIGDQDAFGIGDFYVEIAIFQVAFLLNVYSYACYR